MTPIASAATISYSSANSPTKRIRISAIAWRRLGPKSKVPRGLPATRAPAAGSAGGGSFFLFLCRWIAEPRGERIDRFKLWVW